MKKTLLIAACLCMSVVSILHAQYKVTKISGRVKTAVGSYVKPGTELNPTDLVIFSSRKDKIWVIIPGKGEKIISPSPQAQSVITGLSQLLSDAAYDDVPTVSTRAAVSIIENIPGAITPEDEKIGKLIIEQENKFLFDPAQFSQSDGVFFLQIDANSQRSVRELKANGDTLIIHYTDFLSESDDPYKRYLLGYYDNTKGKSITVGYIRPYFDLTNEMEDIIANTVNTYKNENMPEDSLRIKAYNNVYSFTGKPNGILFTRLFEKYWQGNIQDTINEKHGRGNNFEETDFLSVPVLTQSATASRDALPSSYSLRQYAPPVGNQGEYSTCTAWASAYATRTIAFAVGHGYSINNEFDKIISNTFSPDFVYNNVQPSGDCNMFASLRKSLAFMADKGALLKKRDIFVCGTAYMNNDFDTAKNYRIKDYQRINDPRDSEESLIFKVKTLLVNKNAIAFGMHTPDSFAGRLESGIWLPTDADYKAIDSVRKKLLVTHDGHAMCLIGYNDDISGGSFEVMNSWGTNYGNKGFYWVNYHDFYLFVTEMYTVSDFGSTNTDSTNTLAKADSSAKARPVAIVSAASASTPTVAVEDTKPRLKGEMELMLLKPDRSFESIDVSERIVNTNGEAVDITPATVNYSYASFNVAKPLFSGNRYKIKFTLSQAAYIYLLSKDEKNNYTRLFPQKERNESPLINFTNATLYLPNEKQNYSLDDTPGRDKMCVLLSKSPIDIKALDEQVAQVGNNIYQTVRNSLASRLIEIGNVKYTNDSKIFFDSEVTDNNVLAFFIEINHL